MSSCAHESKTPRVLSVDCSPLNVMRDKFAVRPTAPISSGFPFPQFFSAAISKEFDCANENRNESTPKLFVALSIFSKAF